MKIGNTLSAIKKSLNPYLNSYYSKTILTTSIVSSVYFLNNSYQSYCYIKCNDQMQNSNFANRHFSVIGHRKPDINQKIKCIDNCDKFSLEISSGLVCFSLVILGYITIRSFYSRKNSKIQREKKNSQV